MTVTLTYSGGTQSINATNGSPNVTAANTTGWVVGANIQATGFATGTTIISFVANTSGVFSTNFTGTTGAVTVTVSSNNATAAFALTASGDTATPQNLINLGLGTLIAPKTIQIYGRTYLQLQIAQGAVYDDTEWTYLLGLYSYMQVNETFTGTWRSGFVLQGSNYVKAKGATIMYQLARAVQGGTSVFVSSGVPAGFPTNKLNIHWNTVAWVGQGGSNYAMTPAAYYANFYNCGHIIFDCFGDAGANGSFTGSYGSIEKLSMLRVIGGIGTGYDATQVTSTGTIDWYCIPTGSTNGTNPDIKLGTPNNVAVSGFAPVFYQTDTTTEFVGVNSTNTEIIDDYVLPTNYPLIANSRNFATNTRQYRRTVSFTINDSAASALTNVTAYITSGSNVMTNAVQAGNFSQKLNTIFLSWVGRSPASGSYIAPLSSLDTTSQKAQFRKYGYLQQSVTYSLVNASYFQPIYMLTDNSLSSISSATAGALTTVGINWTTKVITPTASITLDQINARMAWELAQTTGSAYVDPRTISGNAITFTSDWSLVINTSVVFSAGSYLTSLAIQTITTTTAINNISVIGNILQSVPVNTTGLKLTGNLTYNSNTATTVMLTSCTITGTLSNTGTATIVINNNSTIGSVGTNVTTQMYATLALTGLNSGSSIYVYDGSGTQKAYVASSSNNYSLDVTGGTGTWTWKVAKYPYLDQTGTFNPEAGGTFTSLVTLLQDIKISQPTVATVIAYTDINSLDKLYDYSAYWETTSAGILFARINSAQGTTGNLGSVNLILDATASDVWAYLSGTNTLTIKSSTLAANIMFNAITTTGTITFEHGSKATCLYTDASGSSSNLNFSNL